MEQKVRWRRRRLVMAAVLGVVFVAVAGGIGLLVTVLACAGDNRDGVAICEQNVAVNVLALLSLLLPVLAMAACGVAGVRRSSFSLILAAALVLGPASAVGVPLIWWNV
jgi:hypothetical protein